MRADFFSASPAEFTPLTADGPAVRTTRGGERSGQRGRVVVISINDLICYSNQGIDVLNMSPNWLG
jgi:hypothetical protein